MSSRVYLSGNDKEEIEQIRMSIQKDYGGIMSPFDAWLLIRGLKTMSVRMERHTSNAEKILTYLKGTNLLIRSIIHLIKIILNMILQNVK